MGDLSIFLDIPEKEYRAMPRLNQSTLKMLLKSKKHFLMENAAKKKSKAMVFGSAFHDYLFMGLDYFNEHYEVCGFNQRAKDKEKERLSDIELYQIKGMVAHLNQYQIGKDLDSYLKEKVILWEMEGYECKAKLDLVDFENKVVIDLKTYQMKDESKDPKAHLWYTIQNLRYDFQAAFYLRGLKALTGVDWTYKFIFMDKRAPYQFFYVQISPEHLKRGEDAVSYCLKIMDSPFDPCGDQNYPKDGKILEKPEYL